MQNLVNILTETLGIWYYIILNAFGVIAILFKVVEYQLKKRSAIIGCAIGSFACWILYFIFQADVVSALINVVCVTQLLVFLQREKYKWANSKLWLYFFVIIQIVIGALTFSKWHDIFAILAGLSSTVAYFVLNKKLYRFISLFSMSSWVLNSVFKWYIIALLHDSFATVSVLVSIVRFDILKQNDETPLNNV